LRDKSIQLERRGLVLGGHALNGARSHVVGKDDEDVGSGGHWQEGRHAPFDQTQSRNPSLRGGHGRPHRLLAATGGGAPTPSAQQTRTPGEWDDMFTRGGASGRFSGWRVIGIAAIWVEVST
jgi:hypothetical protein